MTNTTTIKPYVVTMYVDAASVADVDEGLGLISEDMALAGVVIKNWIVDDDETPDQHQ